MAVSDDPGVSQQLLAAIFCDQCQITYVPFAVGLHRCPQCGSVPAANSVAHSTALHSDGKLRASQETHLDQLLGQCLGVYQVEQLLGAGAMGRVYLAKHAALQRSCALKILPPRMAQSDPVFVSRFINEGRAAAALVHPNIVTVHSIGDERGYHYLEMEFIAGSSLQFLISEDGPQSPERATALASRIAEGLSFAHSRGILHRDLKLDNVLLTHHGVPKIADFGLARRVVVQSTQGGTDEIVGTPPYMAPELFGGAHATPSSDVYALGVCYYALLTGRYPFYSENLGELIQQVQNAPLPDPRKYAPGLSLEMAECLHLLLARTPANRPADAYIATQLLLAVLGQTEDLESLLRAAFERQANVEWTRHKEGFRAQIRFSNGRQQVVFIEPSQHAAADRLLTITSICAKADPEYYETALRLNSEILHGGLALREIDGELWFVMLDNYPRSTVDAEEIRRSTLEVAHRADSVERLLTGADVH